MMVNAVGAITAKGVPEIVPLDELKISPVLLKLEVGAIE